MIARRRSLLLLVGWMVAVPLWGWYYVASTLSGPPSGNLYANAVSFQILCFAIVRLPFAVLGPIVVVVAVMRQSHSAHNGRDAG
jgi:hypothetical protein